MHGECNEIRPPQLLRPCLRCIPCHCVSFTPSFHLPSLIYQNRPERSRTRSSHPPLAPLIGWTTSPPFSQPTKGVPIPAWRPRFSHPTSTENARIQSRVSLRPGARTRPALSSVGHQARWSIISRNSGESRTKPCTQRYSNIQERVQTRIMQFRGSSDGSQSHRLRRMWLRARSPGFSGRERILVSFYQNTNTRT